MFSFFQLLLREVKKFTDTNNTTEYHNLETAIQKVKESNDSINEKKRQDENMKKIIDVQNSIVGEKLVWIPCFCSWWWKNFANIVPP